MTAGGILGVILRVIGPSRSLEEKLEEQSDTMREGRMEVQRALSEAHASSSLEEVSRARKEMGKK